MKKIRPIFFLLFIFLNFSATAQKNRQDYIKIIDTTLNPELKLAAIDSLLTISLNERAFNDFIAYTAAYIDLAEKLERYDDMAKKAMNTTYPLTTYTNEPHKAIDLINRVMPYEKELTDSFLTGGIYLKRGGAYFDIDPHKAIDDYALSIERFEKKDILFIADAHLFTAQAYSGLGQFVLASEHYKTAYDYFEKEKDYEFMMHARSGEIIMYSKNGFSDKAIQQREALIDNLIDMELYQYVGVQYYNQSVDYKKKNDYDKRNQLLQSALKYADSSVNPTFNYATVYSALSDHFSITGSLQTASDYLKKADEYLVKIPDNKQANSVYLMALIQYQLHNGQLLEAKENSIKRIELLGNTGFEEEIINSHKVLSEIYLRLGDSQKALEHYKKHADLKEVVYSQSKTNALLYYQTLYETERTEKELVEKNSSIAMLQEKNDAIKKQYMFGGVTLTLGFILLLLYKNQRSLKNKRALQQKYTQDLLLAQEEERKRVSKDLHDGIGQSLLLIKNKVVLNRDESTKSLIEDAIEEVRSISRALHPFQLQEMGITKAIKNIIYQVDETTELFISSEIETIDGLFNLQQEVNLYRIVQESLNNVLKHAKATSVVFKLLKNEKSIILHIKDNGIGFDFSEKHNDFNSLGLKTLKERTRFLKGIMKIDSQVGKATVLEFIIPYK